MIAKKLSCVEVKNLQKIKNKLYILVTFLGLRQDYIVSRKKNYIGQNFKKIIQKDQMVWVHCWGGSGRSSQLVGMYINLLEEPSSADVLLTKILKFNNNKDLFETAEQKNFIKQLQHYK